MRCDFREYCGSISGTSSDLEDIVARLELRGIGHQRDDVRLRNCLPLFDWKRLIFVSEFGEIGREEILALNGSHRGKHAWICDAARADVTVHH
jgi:hypothetical protein